MGPHTVPPENLLVDTGALVDCFVPFRQSIGDLELGAVSAVQLSLSADV